MLIKHMDHIAQNDQFDINVDGDVPVYLAEIKGFTEDKGLAEWEIVEDQSVPKSLLHYDDTADGSNKLNGSWREFYSSGASFGEQSIYKGSAIFYKDGLPNFRGVAKAVIYLRYSQGFLNWLEVFDPEAASMISTQRGDFENLIENPKTKKLIAVWDKFRAPKKQWALPVICTLSNTKKLVFGLAGSLEDDWDDFKEMNVDVEKSLELMGIFESPKSDGLEIISEVLQMGGGLGRNPFGKSYKLDHIKDAEYTRLMGTIPKSSRKDLLDIWANKCSYRIKVAPNPDSSELLYFPEGELQLSALMRFSNEITERRTRYFEAKKTKLQKNEDAEGLLFEKIQPIPLPQEDQVTLYLINTEGSQKKKVIIQETFPSVSLDYLACVDAELLGNNTQGIIVNYMKKSLTAQDKDTPSVYIYWTKVFTSILQKNYISAYEIFNSFQRFSKAHSGDELIDKGRARDYFRVIGKIKRLQHLVHTARNEPQSLHTISHALNDIERNNLTTKGVFGMETIMPKVTNLIGDVYNQLREKQQEKLNAFISQSWPGVPSEDFRLFVRGGLVGILLNELTWMVKQEGRSFSVTQGRHPSTLRGKDIQRVFEKGIGLLINLDKQHLFNGKAALFIQSCIEESRKDSFNSGLIMGLVFIHKSTNTEGEK